ncbi:MAG: HAMP domain-containing protein [Proteobacteria bacterium]|nr:HAMP domain-containing protein [Pseudomonadota bacterium]
MAPLVTTVTRAARRLVRTIWQSQDLKMRLGEVLVARGLVTRRQLREALDLQTDRYFRIHSSEPLGRLIVEKGFATEAEVVDAIRAHYRIPAVALDEDLGELVRLRREIQAASPVRLPLWLQSMAGVTVLVLGAWLLTAALVDRDTRGQVAGRMATGQAAAVLLSERAGDWLLAGDRDALFSLAEASVAAGGLEYAAFLDTQGGVVARARSPQPAGKPIPGSLEDLSMTLEGGGLAGDDGRTHLYTQTLALGFRVSVLARPVFAGRAKVGQVLLAMDLEAVRAQGRWVKLALAGLLGGLWLAGVLGALLLARFHVQRLNRLAEAANAAARGDLRSRLPYLGVDEISDLARSLDHMTQAVQARILSQDSFGRQVGPEVLEKVLGSPHSPWVRGRRASATVLACDVAALSDLLETLPPERVVEGLNAVVAEVARAVRKAGGYVERGAGCVVMGLFGVPAASETHGTQAARAALAVMQALSDSPDPVARATSVGISSGSVVTGFVGSEDDPLEYSVSGACVREARTLALAADTGRILISADTAGLLADGFVLTLCQGGGFLLEEEK